MRHGILLIEQGYEDVRNCPAVSLVLQVNLAIQRENWSFVAPIINSKKRRIFTKIQESWEQAKIMQMLIAVMELTSTVHCAYPKKPKNPVQNSLSFKSHRGTTHYTTLDDQICLSITYM